MGQYSLLRAASMSGPPNPFAKRSLSVHRSFVSALPLILVLAPRAMSPPRSGSFDGIAPISFLTSTLLRTPPSVRRWYALKEASFDVAERGDGPRSLT